MYEKGISKNTCKMCGSIFKYSGGWKILSSHFGNTFFQKINMESSSKNRVVQWFWYSSFIKSLGTVISNNPQQALLWRDDDDIWCKVYKKVGWLVLKKLHQQAKVVV